ncbi:tetratricopeptide repeat protein [Bacillus paramycoides]|uniref:tetratricopeptide repeat protein n=1 Tax=Bacillus paramycoides TaxID=2026194 RepID=UPI004057D0B7
MNTLLTGSTYATKHLESWYHAILTQNVTEAQTCYHAATKEHEEILLQGNEVNSSYHLFFDLLKFRYAVFTEGLSITKDSFEAINAYAIPSDLQLSYLYHYYKAIYYTALNKFDKAADYFEKAKSSLTSLTHIEQADFYYRYAVYHFQMQQPSQAIVNATKALDIFQTLNECERNVTSCLSVLGGSYVAVEHYEKAEELYYKAIDILQKLNEESLLLHVRNNLGTLYANQDLSEQAIRQLSTVIDKIPNHYKALFLLAQENGKLGNIELANKYIQIGKEIVLQLDNEEYKHHFSILEAMINKFELEQLDKVIQEGINYFNEESLFSYTSEYCEKVATIYHKKQQFEKASEYFFNSIKAKKKSERRL